MSYDYNKLKGRIIEKFGTQGKFAKAMGVSERTLSLKINDKVPFTQPEITKAIKLLELDESDIQPYFFALKTQSA